MEESKDYTKELVRMGFKRNSKSWKKYDMAKARLIKQPFDIDYEAKIAAIIDYFNV